MRRILLVEDNEMNRDMLCRRLQRRGFEMLLAGDGQEGIDLAIDTQPDLVLMDLSLPVVDGWEATRKIKQHTRGAHIPIIALTAHALSEDRDGALQAGCDDFDTKPIELDRLMEKITRLLRMTPSNQEV